jgi:hypothetical protein
VRVVCPFTNLHPVTDASLARHAPEAERVNVAATEYSYGLLFMKVWGAGEDFCLVEHDLEVRGETFPRCAGSRTCSPTLSSTHCRRLGSSCRCAGTTCQTRSISCSVPVESAPASMSRARRSIVAAGATRERARAARL